MKHNGKHSKGSSQAPSWASLLQDPQPRDLGQQEQGAAGAGVRVPLSQVKSLGARMAGERRKRRHRKLVTAMSGHAWKGVREWGG